MSAVLGRLAIALALAVAAWLSWSEARLAARVADAKLDVATFKYDGIDALTPRLTMSDVVPGGGRLHEDIRMTKAAGAYWLGRYGDIAANSTEAGTDAAILLSAANGAYRDAQREAAAGPAAVQRLDGVLQAYAAAMKASGPNARQAWRAGARRSLGEVGAEAAYNYEYVARIRDQAARAPQGKAAKAVPAPAPAGGRAGDLPIGPTIHGRPGAPPPDAKMEELKMIAPMDFGDRETQPEATPGAKRERKG
jgi:hypothetical protein